MEFPCKFSEKGCKEVGARTAMQNHIGRCIFGNNMECPDLSCKVKMSLGEVVEHLKIVHRSPEWEATDSGEIMEKMLLYNELRYKLHAVPDANYIPIIASIEGETFLIHSIKRDFTTIFWVSIVGIEKDACKFEVKIIASPDEDAPLSIRTKGKVYSLEMKTEDIIKDASNTLEITKNMANRMGTNAGILFHIVRK